MKVVTDQPYQIVYSLFEHEYLGYLFESFLVQLDEQGRFTFTHQNISSKNAREFSKKLDSTDFELIALIDEMQQGQIIKKFHKKKTKADEFFSKVYDPSKGDELIQNEIERYLEARRCKVLSKVAGKNVFEMGKDGEPAWKRLHVQEKKATILFHFRKNEDNTHYFPTIKHNGEKLDFQYKGAILVCNNPAWMLLNNKIYRFEKELDGKKLQPFLNKKFILIPEKVEETYYKKFVAPLIASFDVYAKGFDIQTERYSPKPYLEFSELVTVGANRAPDLFDQNKPEEEDLNRKIFFELKFKYNGYSYSASSNSPVNVELEKENERYTFHRISRKREAELEVNKLLIELGLPLKSGKATLEQSVAFEWISSHHAEMVSRGIIIEQTKSRERKYFIGDSVINMEVNENIDWFDIEASVFFGQFEIPFHTIRQYILRKKREFELPNGEIAVIPEAWFTQFSELMAFMEHQKEDDRLSIKKHHLTLVQDLQSGKLAQITLSKKLQELQNFEEIEDHPLPESFKGELRPYQKAGYNWMQFLRKYNFGGCLADDMGLGKTVQTLAALQAEKESDSPGASLLIMPTSLIYNWQMEAKKFTPNLKVLVYSGTQRIKETSYFKNYDLILTSYGIARLDVSILETYYFNYIILDESQAIKNPDSNIAKAVKRLHSKHRLILTGTPIENSTLDLWSQMTFINPGLLGNQKFFKNEFVLPIEKKRDEVKTSKLNSIIKPFILRREKSQVATDLPEKIEHVQYVSMTAMQEEVYEEVKSSFRNQILNSIELNGLNNSSMLLLQGLTKLRQIANHPKMVDTDYKGDSGKLDDAIHMLASVIRKDHNVLIFSQFVKQLAIFEDVLRSREIKYAYLDGSTKDRKGQVEKFQKNEEIKVFLISLKAGGLGLNLTKADYVFILDPWWNPAAEAQAVDRAHRIGQENTVFTYKFITQGTVEEKILSLQKKKLQLASSLISTEGSFVKNLTKDDIQSLLS
ncbi:MAG: DEAD/DEAH box helicase [Bacteroidota bacterium]